MQLRLPIRALGAALFLTATATAAQAAGDAVPGSGALRPFGPDGEPLADCPLEHTDVSVDIAGFVARVRVTQTFTNPHPHPIEAVYTFPLSSRGAVDAMWMRTGDRTIRAEIERREEARRIYEAARQAGQVASLLDQERPNVFTQSVANLMPGAEVEIEIHYVEPLEFEDGAFEFSFPTVVGPRFVPPGVPDAERITPPVTPQGTRAGHDIAIEVDIDAGVPIRALDSELHRVEIDHRDGSPRAHVELASRDEIPNRDFVLRYTVAGEQLRSGYLAHRGDTGDGYATFVLLPPERVTPRSAAPKELVFVIDRSGSQSGLPLAKAKETLLWILDHMNPNDTFQVIDFGSSASQLFDRPRLASASMKARARRYIEALQANGGTMMADAVRAAAAGRAEDGRLRVVTFMTDGYIGNDFEVIGLVRSLRGTSRWFPFGTGNSVNRFLLDEMARAGGGEVETVLLNRPGEEVARQFWERIASPVLTDVRLEFRGLDVYDVFPGAVSDVWANRPLIFHARYGDGGRGSVVVHGRRGGEPYREELRVVLPDRAADHEALASIWARAKVDDLMRRDLQALQSGSFPDALREEIVEVALAHRLVTQFTSFVAVEDRVVNREGRLETVTVPVEMPQGVTYEGVFGEEQPFARGLGGRALSLASKTMPAPHAPVARVPAGQYEVHAENARGGGQLGQLRALGYLIDAREDEDDAPPPAETEPLSERARERLAPELRLLLDPSGGGAAPGLEILNGRVRIEVLVGDALDAELTARLEEAGLDIEQQGDDWATGWIDLSALRALAELEDVRRIDSP